MFFFFFFLRITLEKNKNILPEGLVGGIRCQKTPFSSSKKKKEKKKNDFDIYKLIKLVRKI